MDTKRYDGESEYAYLWRMGCARDAGTLDGTWDDVAKVCAREFELDGAERGESCYRKAYQYARKFYDDGVLTTVDENTRLREIREAERELKKERMKFQSEKIEYNKWLREEARDELITENLAAAVRSLPPVPEIKPAKGGVRHGSREGVLCFADPHYGAEFEIKGLDGGLINAYSPEIFEKRMNQLLALTIEKVSKEGFDSIHVISLGDEIAGLLRVSQLLQLRYGVVESTVKYANYITRWLYDLSRSVKIKYYSVEGNHSELRMLGQPKGTFQDENMSRVIREMVKIGLKDDSNFEYIENPSGLPFAEIAGCNVLGIHGEVKSMESAIDTYSAVYGKRIDILLGGHIHHYNAGTVGRNRDFVSVPCIMGTDDYAMSLGKNSNPGALFLTMEDGRGIVEQSYLKFDV